MGKRNGRYCCECDLCAAGPCQGGAYCLFLTDDPDVTAEDERARIENAAPVLTGAPPMAKEPQEA